MSAEKESAPQGLDQAQSPSTLPTDAAASDSAPPHVDYQKLFDTIKSKPCKVVQLELEHENDNRTLRTKPHIIDRELQRVHDAGTLEEIHIALEEAGRNLQQLGIFSNVDMLVDEEPLVRF